MTHRSIVLVAVTVVAVAAFCPQQRGCVQNRQAAFVPSNSLKVSFASRHKMGEDDLDMDLDLEADLFGSSSSSDLVPENDKMLVSSDGGVEVEVEVEAEEVEEEEEDENSVGKSAVTTASDYDAAVDMNADIEIEEEDEDDEFDLTGIDEEDDMEDDFDYEEEDESEPKEKLYEMPTLEQLEKAVDDNKEEISMIDIDYLERKGLNEEIEADPTSQYELAGDYGGERPDADETSPWYMAEQEIDDGRQWNYTALMLSAIKRNPDMPYARPDWFEKVRLEMGLPDVDLVKEQYQMEFSEIDVEGADTSLVEEFYSLRARVLPVADDVNSADYEKSQEQREFFMARIKVHEEVAEGEDIESLEARWQAWFEEVYEEEQLEQQFKLINQDEENMREDYHWHERYRHLEERCFRPGLNAKLVIAVKGEREDLKKCEMVTQRMRAEFGDDIYVETQVFPEASEEDYLFEVWIVAYEDELLFSRRKHYYDQEWPGPDDFRSEDLEKLVEEVRFHLSEDAKNGFLFT